MTVNQYIRIFAGAFILISLLLAHLNDQVNLLKFSWLWVTVFVGANLFQSGFTRWCLLEDILIKLGVKQDTGGCA